MAAAVRTERRSNMDQRNNEDELLMPPPQYTTSRPPTGTTAMNNQTERTRRRQQFQMPGVFQPGVRTNSTPLPASSTARRPVVPTARPVVPTAARPIVAPQHARPQQQQPRPPPQQQRRMKQNRQASQTGRTLEIHSDDDVSEISMNFRLAVPPTEQQQQQQQQQPRELTQEEKDREAKRRAYGGGTRTTATTPRPGTVTAIRPGTVTPVPGTVTRVEAAAARPEPAAAAAVRPVRKMASRPRLSVASRPKDPPMMAHQREPRSPVPAARPAVIVSPKRPAAPQAVPRKIMPPSEAELFDERSNSSRPRLVEFRNDPLQISDISLRTELLEAEQQRDMVVPPAVVPLARRTSDGGDMPPPVAGKRRPSSPPPARPREPSRNRLLEQPQQHNRPEYGVAKLPPSAAAEDGYAGRNEYHGVARMPDPTSGVAYGKSTHESEDDDDEDDEDGPWQCQVCTFVNENALHLTCEVCGEARRKTNVNAMRLLQNETSSIDSDAAIYNFNQQEEQSPLELMAEISDSLQELEALPGFLLDDDDDAMDEYLSQTKRKGLVLDGLWNQINDLIQTKNQEEQQDWMAQQHALGDWRSRIEARALYLQDLKLQKQEEATPIIPPEEEEEEEEEYLEGQEYMEGQQEYYAEGMYQEEEFQEGPYVNDHDQVYQDYYHEDEEPYDRPREPYS